MSQGRPATLPALLQHIEKRYGSREALVALNADQRVALTHTEIARWTAKTRRWLQEQEIGAGDRVLVCATNTAETLVAMLACGTLGAAVIPVDLKTSGENLGHIVKAGQAKLALTTRDELVEGNELLVPVRSLQDLFTCVADLAPLPAATVDPDQLLVLFFTSGTTGTPKGVQTTHRNLVSNVLSVSQVDDLERDDRTLTMAPLSHALGLSIGLFIPWYSGNLVIISASLAPETMLRIFHSERVTAIVTVPLFLDRGRAKIESALRDGGRLRTFRLLQTLALRLPLFARRLIFAAVLRQMAPWLRWVAVGGAALDLETERFWEAIGVQIVKGYGLTETFIASCTAFRQRRLGSVGFGLPGQEIRLAADGEILLRGPHVMPGYLAEPSVNEACFRDGWFCTGDVGRFDDDGYLFITGRIKNVIIGSAGLNIYPEDVELVLRERDEVDECVVIESPDDQGRLWGVVIPRFTVTEVDLEAIRVAVNERLSAHQRLTRLLRWPDEDFPRTPTQKVRRNLVIEACAKQAGAIDAAA